VIRTFSKAWGLAGARIGYAIGSPVLVQAMNRVGLPYPLSLLSSRTAVRALDNAGAMERSRGLLVGERERLARELEALGVRPLPSDANFLLFRVKEPQSTQRRLAEDYGIIIRDRSRMPGLDGGLRVTVGTPEQNDRFLEALREVLS
jgi:histidinol-phosphate aminotransferase